MDSFEKSRRSTPIPSGSIPYGVFSRTVGDIVYSIDKFRPRFPLSWGELRIQREGKFLPVNDANVLESVRCFLRSVYPFIEAARCDHGPGKMGGNLYWWRFNGGIITLHKFKPFGSDECNYSLLMEFNPNKGDLKPWYELISALQNRLFNFCWHNTRMDYALDIPFPISDVRLLTRKIGSSYQGTYYFGTRGSSGYTRVYDKRKEILDKQRQDIGREVTRIEWESRSGDPLHMDFPFIISDLGRYEVLRYVSICDWPAALKTFDQRTAAKIRRGLLPVEVDSMVFDELSAGLLSYLGLSSSDNLDHIEKKRLDASDAADLERIQSQLRKWAGVDH